jgi:peptidoglycan/LPS O-acetylase OafA/YrhL
MFAGFNSGIARAKADLGTGITSNTLLIFFMTLTFTLWLVPQLWNTVIPGGWSIQAEVFHYIFYPLLRKSNPRNILRLLIGVNLFTLLSARAMELDLFAKNSSLGIIIAAWIRLNFYSTVGYFLIGYSLSHLTASMINWQDISRTFMHKGLIELFIYGFTFIFLPLSFGIQVQALIYVSIMLFLNYVFVSFSVFQPILITLGKYSYFIYFCHFLVLDVFRWSLLRFNFEIPWYLCQFVWFLIFQTFAIVISLTLAFVSFKLFESPIINWVKRF